MPPLKDSSGNLITEDQEKTELLNLQFQENFSQEDVSSIPFYNCSWPRMSSIKVSEHGILHLLTGLNTSKAAGPDEIYPRILKEVASEIAPVLRCVFQTSLDSGTLPMDWRKAHICPIYKKGDKSATINYRPISLTSIICKLLEHIVCSNLTSHLELNGIITPKQHAFRKHRSCTTQLCTVIHDWCKSFDDGLQTDAFILDFAIFVCGSNLKWIDAFLCHRSQRVIINGAKSE